LKNRRTKMENVRKLTTLELIDEYIDADLEMQMCDNDNELTIWIDKINEIKDMISTKQLNLKEVMLSKKTDEQVIKAEIDVHRDFISKLKRRQDSISSVYEFLENLIITTVENTGEQTGENKFTVENSGHKFTVFQTPGKLEILDENSVPEEFKGIEIKISKAALRKHVIANKDCDYAKVEKVKRLKIT